MGGALAGGNNSSIKLPNLGHVTFLESMTAMNLIRESIWASNGLRHLMHGLCITNFHYLNYEINLRIKA